MKTALILIDIQNDYFPGGKMELEGTLEAANRAHSLLDLFRKQGRPTVHIQHIALRPDATFFLPDTDGAVLHPSIAPLPDEMVIIQHFPNSFRETSLLEHLKNLGIELLVIGGMMTHMCVDATTRAAADFGYPVLLASDTCATRALAFGNTEIPARQVQAVFLAALKSYAQVLSSQEVITQLESPNS